MNIIQQAMEIITRSYADNLEKALRGRVDFSDMVMEIEQDFRKTASIMVQDILENLDQAVKESKVRKRDWYVERSADEKTLHTVLGEIRYKRTYYVHKKTGAYAYLSDEQVNIEPHERMDAGLKARILEHASTMSYQETIDKLSYSGITSKMSVLNVLRRTEPISNMAVETPDRKDRTPEILYIEADEDHVSLQSGSSTISKIAYVHEGRKQVYKNRFELINKRYFTALSDNESLWLDIADYLEQTYDMDKVKTVFISGDGASWIKEGTSWIDKGKYVMDRFHFQKAIRRATAHMEHAREPLQKYMRKGMKRAVFDLLDEIISKTESKSKRKAVQDVRTYFWNNWVGIQRQKAKGYVGCSAEGHVSHVLSDRLSSRPMGWSKQGMKQMSSMRVFKGNGGNFHEHLKSEYDQLRTAERILKLDKRILQKAKKVSGGVIPNVTFMTQGKRSGTSVILKSIRGL